MATSTLTDLSERYSNQRNDMQARWWSQGGPYEAPRTHHLQRKIKRQTNRVACWLMDMECALEAGIDAPNRRWPR